MASKNLKYTVIVLLLLTIGSLLWHKYGMNEYLVIDADTQFELWTNDDREMGGSTVAQLKKVGDYLVLTCKFSRDYLYPYCAFYVTISRKDDGVNLSNYNFITLDVSTSESTEQGIRVFLHQYDPGYSKPDEVTSNKIHEMYYRPLDEPNPFTADLKVFQVATWWINERDVPPVRAQPDLSNVVGLGFGISQYEASRTHEIFFKSIKFHGKWVSVNFLQSIIISCWVIMAFIYLFYSFWQARNALFIVRQQEQQLAHVDKALNLSRDNLADLATHDSITGILSRAGFRNHLHAQISLVKQNRSVLSIIFMDVDKYKRISEVHSYSVNDQVLFDFVNLIKSKTRSQDIFCRWEGDSFCLLCYGTPLESGVLLAKKLRKLIREASWPAELELSCSFGVAQMDPDEDVLGFVQRARQALNMAKASGGDCVRPELPRREMGQQQVV